MQSKSYGKWTIYDDINELALNNYTNLIRNGSKTWVLVELRNLQVERIIEVEGSCLIFLRFVAAVIFLLCGALFFPQGPFGLALG